MLLGWDESLNIGVPEIDAEHKYLVALINNLHDDFEAEKFDRSVSDAFAHLIKYVEKHFRNEESLMLAGHYPLLMEHIQQHENLTDDLSDLVEKYMSGEQHLSEEMMLFLRDWVLNHVLAEDKKIGTFFEANPLPHNWTYIPAYVDSSEMHFKVCSCCGKSWKTFDDLARDQEKVVLGCMADDANQLFNIIIFNCSCGTTLAIPISDFIDHCSVPFEFEDRPNDQVKPDYCLRKDEAGHCLSRCICAYTNNVLTALRGLH